MIAIRMLLYYELSSVLIKASYNGKVHLGVGVSY